MRLGCGAILLILSIVLIHHSECGERSAKISSSHLQVPDLSSARRTQQKTTRRSIYRTTTHRYRTTRRSYPITTTPRPHRVTTHRTTTRKPTRQHIITTTPWTTRKTTRRHHITTTPWTTPRTTTSWSRPPPYNPQWTTRRQNNGSHTTRQPPYNPFFSSSTRPPITTQRFRPLGSGAGNGSHTTRQPPYNPFFSSSTRPPITTQHLRPLGSGAGNGSYTTRQPPYNPFLSSSFRPPITTQHFRPLGSGLGNGSHTTRQPPYNPFFTSSTRPTFVTTQHFRTVGTGLGNGSHTTRQTQYNPFYSTTTRRTVLGSGNFTAHGNYGNRTHEKIVATTKRSTHKTTPAYIWNTKTNTSSLGSGIPPGFVIPRRNQSSMYHPPGNAFNQSKINQRPIYNTPQGNNYPGVYPIQPAPPVPLNHGSYHPGGGYYPSGYPQQQQPPHVTIINNNVHTQNHHVIYPSQHWTSYGPPASGVTIINNNNNNYHNLYHPPPRYHYSTSDYGSSTLGFYLGYRLGQLSRPSYHYHGTYYENDRYVPRYDHYVIHHYDHERTSVPKEAVIPSNIIVTCDGDSGSICPTNTVPLCTNNAAVMCVANAFSTTTCEQDKNYQCVRSSVPCVNSDTKECQGKTAAAVSVPCISTAKVEGVPDFINNTLVFGKGAGNEPLHSLCVTVLAVPSTNATTDKKSEQVSTPFQYTTNDTGADSLGIYLGQTLPKLEYPSYVYLNYDNNMKYTDRFDHYNIYHYYHGGYILPNVTSIYPNSTIACAGDSGTICPQNSSSLCFSDGGVACLTDVTSTIYNNETKTRLVLTSVPCAGSRDPACIGNNATIPLVMPCISIAKVYSNTSYLINSVSSANGTMRYYKTINLLTNASSNATLPTPREFCVTILLLPGEKTVRLAPKSRRVTGIKSTKGYLSLPKYSYSAKRTSNKTLAYYLAQRLDKMRYPSFYFVNALVQAQDGTVQLYDHLSVHHYYDGKEVIPDSMNLQSSSMVICQGDSGVVCPANTSALCLNDGSIMCVTDLLLTEPCARGPYCLKSTLPCKNVNAPKCKGVERVHVTLPCISILDLRGDVQSVDNSIYHLDKKSAKPYVDLHPSTTQVSNKSQLFCMSVVLLPEVRVVTEGEKVINATRSIFANFAIKILGIS